MTERLPFGKKILYALGQFGWSLASFAPGNLLVYFYMPPEQGEAVFAPRIHQGAILGVLTLIGLAYGVGRLFDAVTDPLIANLSDRSRSSMGRRRIFLLMSVLPFAGMSLLVFTPPTAAVSVLNNIWVFAGIIIFYWFMTMYVTPYYALMSELGHDPDERLQLSTMISITWALGFALGTQVFAFKGIFENAGMTPEAAFRTVIAAFAVLGFGLMLLPILFIDEKRYSKHEPSDVNLIQSLVGAFKNKDFLVFTLSDLAYWSGLTIVTTGLVYYVTILMRAEEALTSTLQLIMFAASFLFYVPVGILARRTGKKKLLIVGFILFMVAFVLVMFMGVMPVSAFAQGLMVAIALALPLAIFGILPNAIVADVTEADGVETGSHKAAIFFGARTFMMKIGQMVGGIIFPSMLLLGNTRENPLGVRLTPIPALVFFVIGLLLFLRYDEKKVLATAAKDDDAN